MDMSTTERNWLAKFTTQTKAVFTDLLKIRRRDYDGWVPPDVAEMRRLKKITAEHGDALEVIKRGILSIAGSFNKKK